MFGNLVIFGSGEASERGKAIHRHVLSTMPRNQNIAILETPAGFQPNSHKVCLDIATIFHTTLSEFTGKVSIIPARKKGIDESPDNPEILSPLYSSNYIFLGPGSPTYAVSQLTDSLALEIILERFNNGASLSLSSAAAMAFGSFTLPVYEIYKAGHDLYWEKGLDFVANMGIPLVIITHFNNKEGGQFLDTRYCYMGEARFNNLIKLLPKKINILGIDEHTAIILDFNKDTFHIDGVGTVTLLTSSDRQTFTTKKEYKIDALKK